MSLFVGSVPDKLPVVKYREHSRDVSWSSLAGEERSPQF